MIISEMRYTQDKENAAAKSVGLPRAEFSGKSGSYAIDNGFPGIWKIVYVYPTIVRVLSTPQTTRALILYTSTTTLNLIPH